MTCFWGPPVQPPPCSLLPLICLPDLPCSLCETGLSQTVLKVTAMHRIRTGQAPAVLRLLQGAWAASRAGAPRLAQLLEHAHAGPVLLLLAIPRPLDAHVCQPHLPQGKHLTSCRLGCRGLPWWGVAPRRGHQWASTVARCAALQRRAMHRPVCKHRAQLLSCLALSSKGCGSNLWSPEQEERAMLLAGLGCTAEKPVLSCFTASTRLSMSPLLTVEV